MHRSGTIKFSAKGVDKEEDCGYNPATMIIRRYIFNHLAKLFLGALLVLYGVMFIVEWIRIGQIISRDDVDILVLALVPMAVFVLPMSLIFSVLMTLEKLSIESEIIAMQASGIPKRTLYTPVLMLALMCLILHVSISTYLGPLSMQRIQERLIQKAPQKVYAFLKEREFIDTFKDITLYIESVNQKKKTLGNVFIETKGKDHSIIAAEKGTLVVRPSGILMKLADGSVFMESKQSLRYITFDEYNFFLDADFRRELRMRSTDALTQPELKKLIKEQNRKPKLVKEYYNRFAFPVLNIILAMIGLQFGIQKPRSPRHTGMVVGFGTIVSYYFLFLMADRLVKADKLNPTIGAWVPDLVFCFIIFALWAVNRFRLRKGVV